MKKSLLYPIVMAGLLLPSLCHAASLMDDPNSIQRLQQTIESLPSGGTINLTFKSKIDDTVQPMLVKVPSNYTREKQWPLLVVLHGRGGSSIVVPSIDSMVQIGPFGRGDKWYRGIGEQDVLECLELAKKIFNIDPDRIYLSGFSMGGAGVFELGLKYPDTWAACVPVCGAMNVMDLIENGGNLPFWIHTGGEDLVVAAKSSEKAYDKAVLMGYESWKYTEHEGMGHSFWINWDDVGKWLLAKKKITNPSQISFTADKPARAYWAEINKIANSANPARIDVHVDSQTVKVTVSNISDYSLYLQDAPVDISRELTIVENDKHIFKGCFLGDGIFKKNTMDNNDDNQERN